MARGRILALLAEARDEKPAEHVRPNFAAFVALLALVLIWYALSPIWAPCLSWLFSFFGSVFQLLGHGLAVCSFLFAFAVFGLVLAAVGMLLGEGFINPRTSELGSTCLPDC